MSILCATSYFQTDESIPHIIKKLDRLLVIKQDNKILIQNIELAKYINNVCVKFGFLYFGIDNLKISIQGDQPKSNFFLSNFIYDSKAFLDSFCMLLNYFYDLELKGGNIDFRKNLFLNSLKNKKPEVENDLQKQHKWICDVMDYRDKIIHRSSIASIIYSKPDKSGKRPVNNIVKMSSNFHSLFDLIQQSGAKKSTDSLDIIEFCEKWIRQAQKMFDIVLSHIEQDYRTKIESK